MTDKEKYSIIVLARSNADYLDIISEATGKSRYTVETILSDRHGRKNRKREYGRKTVELVWNEAAKLAKEQAEAISAVWLPDENLSEDVK